LGRICSRPTNATLTDMVKKATSRMRALIDGAMRQVRHTGLPDEARSNSTPACASGTRRPQKCVVWMIVDTRMAANHTTATQLNPFADRCLMFTVLNTTGDLDATTLPLSGSQPQRIWLILASKDRPHPISSNCPSCPPAPFWPLPAPFSSAHLPWDRTA
jgi:hypothetical protein